MAIKVYSVCSWDMQLVEDRQVAYDNHELVVGFNEYQKLVEALDELANGLAGNAWDVGLQNRLIKARALLEEAK